MNPDTRTQVLEYARLALEETLKIDESVVPGAMPRKERMQLIITELGATHEEILAKAAQLMDPVE